METMIISDKITDNDISKLKSFIADDKVIEVMIYIDIRGGYVGDPKFAEFTELLKSEKVIPVAGPSHTVTEYFGSIADKNMKIGTKVKLNK